MKLLLDTQLLLWIFGRSNRLSGETKSLLDDRENELHFSAVSIWEIGIKQTLRRFDFAFAADAVRNTLLANGYQELTLTGEQAQRIAALPLLHKDPFDRILLVQAASHGLTLVTSDRMLARYPGQITLV